MVVSHLLSCRGAYPALWMLLGLIGAGLANAHLTHHDSSLAGIHYFHYANSPGSPPTYTQSEYQRRTLCPSFTPNVSRLFSAKCALHNGSHECFYGCTDLASQRTWARPAMHATSQRRLAFGMWRTVACESRSVLTRGCSFRASRRRRCSA